jgi:anti-sigma-K factor RskA
MSGEHDNRWSENLAAYLLGALDTGEAAELERHLEGCERCRREMRWLQPAVGTLPESIERRQPPRRLRDNLMAEVRAQAPRAPSRSRRWMLRPVTGFAAAALLIAVAVGYEIGMSGSGHGDGGGGGKSTLVAPQPNGITVKMVREGDGGRLQLANVRQLPRGKVLEAWVRRDGKVEPVPALFAPDRRGRAETTIEDMRGVDTVMVTAEPRGGSEAPTSEPIVTMSVPQ